MTQLSRGRRLLGFGLLLAAGVLTCGIEITSASADSPAEVKSHPPIRPLPAATSRPLASGPGRYVDAMKGNDVNDGSREKPWKTLAHAVKQLKPGDTLYLRDGIYYEQVKLKQSG